MSNEEAQLRVKSGGQILGPMTIFQIADLLAEGRLSESDLVSADNGPWVTVERYVQGDAPSADTSDSSEIDSLFGDDFSIEFDLGPAAAPAVAPPARARRAAPPAEPSTPSPRRAVPPVPRDDEILELEPIEMKAIEDPPEVEVLEDLDEDDDGTGESTYRLTGGGSPPAYRKPEPPPFRSAPQRRSKPSARRRPDPDEDETDSDAASEDQLMRAMKALAREEGSAPSSTPVLRRALPPREGEALRSSGPQLPPPAPAGLGPDFRPLFNGRDLNGWDRLRSDGAGRGGAEAWSASGGVLRYDGSARQLHLVSTAEFCDFELWICWRALGPDSQGGLMLRSEVQDGGSRSWISMSEKDAGRLLGADVSGSSAVPAFQNPPESWNVWRVVAAGTRIGLWCNKQCAWSTAKLTRRRGRLGLRGDGTPFEFRYLHFRELKRK